MNKNKNSKNKTEYQAKKYFGQNFLHDSSIINQIIEKSGVDENTIVLEIGPGTGALTKELVKYAKKVIAYEIDTEILPILKEKLKNYSNYEIINEDILKADLSYINSLENIITVSNIPYYITSPLIELFIKKLTALKSATFMVQKEVGDRICAKVGTKDYNAFSIMVQYYAITTKLINVPRSAFTPSPNVDSAVIKIERFDRNIKPGNEELFEKVVYASFKERRKMLVNNLSTSFNLSKDDIKNILTSLELDAQIRAELLTIEDFIKLTNEIEKHIK